jgi:glucosylglycerate synthase
MASSKRFSSSLRDHVRKKIELLGHADIVVGIPSYYSDGTIAHVVKTVAAGLDQYYRDARGLIFVADGGSTDDTREIARGVETDSFNIEKIVTVYRGIPGKGSGLRGVFEAAGFLRAKAVSVFDSDLMSITPEWIRNILEPVFNGHDFVSPDYQRYKLDGTITNTIAYNLTRSLYGLRIRQPIGGDFGLSLPLVKHYLDHDVWESDVAKFGIDIWMTTTAVTGGFKVCQGRLGAKIHGHKNPAEHLGPMFRQVVGTTFQLMEQYTDYWMKVTGSQSVPVFGDYMDQVPPAFEIDQDDLIEYFRLGFHNFSGIWKQIVDEEDYDIISCLAGNECAPEFRMPIESWVRVVYRYAGAFHTTPRQKIKILDTMIPLYYGRVASLMNELKDMDSDEAERHFEKQAVVFEEMKPYLIDLWNGSEVSNG